MSVTTAPVDAKARGAWLFRVLGVTVTDGQGDKAKGLRARLETDKERLKSLGNDQVEHAVEPLLRNLGFEIDAGDAGAALPLFARLEEVLDAAERKKNAQPQQPEPPKDPTKELLEDIIFFKNGLDTTDKRVKENVKQFGQFLHLDDIVLSGGIKTAEKTRLLKLIDATVRIVEQRGGDMVTPARQLAERIKLDPDPEVQKSADLQPETLKTVNFWVSLIPSGIYDEAPMIKDRVAALTVEPGSEAQKKQITGAEQKIAGLKGQVDEFKQSVESHSSRSFARTDPFATKMLTSLDPEEEKKFRALTEELARAGQVFLDATVSIERLNDQGMSGDQRETRYDFQALYDKIAKIGLPESWWPPRLVERVQAWRKASRIHQNETVKPKSTAKEIGTELLGAFSQLSKLSELGNSIVSFQGSFKPPESGPDHSPEVLADMAGKVCTILDGMPENVKGILSGETAEQLKALNPFEAIDLGERLDNVLALLQKPTEFASQVTDLVEVIGKYQDAPWAKTFTEKVAPGLGLAIHVLKLIDAIKETAKSALLTGKTQRLGVTSDQQNATGLRQDGGTTTGALKKAELSQKEYTARKGLEVFTESGNVTAQSVTLSGIGAPIGYGLTASVAGIELAGEMVFDTIDWSHAKVAKQLLADARAGSPIAQQLLFEKCELYAKLYLAILVREGDPLGKKYIVDRGITQDALDKPTSVWLLGEALRGAVQKEDDTEIDGNLAKHLAGPLGKLAGRLVDGIGDGVMFVVEKGRQALSEDYDANWTPPKPPALDPAVWTEIKDSAVENAGLRNDTSGITDALTALAKVIADYGALSLPPKKGQQPPTDKDKLKAISIILQQIGTASGVMTTWHPVQGKDPRAEHAPMRAVLDAMQKLLGTLGNDRKKDAAKLPGVTMGVPDKDGNQVLDIGRTAWTGLAAGGKCQTQWTGTWKIALDSIGLADEDFGAAKLLGTVQREWDALQQLEGQSQIVGKDSGKALYKARKGTLDALMAARDAIGQVMKGVSLFPNLAAFVTAAHTDMATRTRALDTGMCEAKVNLSLNHKPALPAHDPKSTAPLFTTWAAMWLDSWKQAADLGFGSADGGDKLSASLNGFGSSYAAYLAVKPNDKSRPVKRDTALGDGAKALKACDALIQAEPYAPDSVLALVRAYATDTMTGRRLLVNEVSTAQVLDPQALKDLQNAIPGAVDSTGKGLITTNDLQGPWEKAYAECVKQGVAAKSDSGGSLGKQLGKIKTAMDVANKLLAAGTCAAKDLPGLYKAMDDVRKEIAAAIKLVNNLLAAPGFAANDQIMDLLSALGAEFTNYLEVIEDRKGKIEVSAGNIDADSFSKVKAMFVKQGLAPNDDTGLSELMKKAKSAKTKDRPKILQALKDKIDEAIDTAEKKVTASKLPPPPPQQGKKKTSPPVELNYQPWINYLKQVKTAAV